MSVNWGLATRTYNNSVTTINQLSALLSMSDKEKILNQFDVILQYSLLQIAITDGLFGQSELDLIKNICAYGDFCNYANQAGFPDVTWKRLFYSDELIIKRLLFKLKERVDHMSKDFITIIAETTAEIPQIDYLETNIAAIILAMCKAGGYIARKESVTNCLITSVLSELKAIKNTN